MEVEWGFWEGLGVDAGDFWGMNFFHEIVLYKIVLCLYLYFIDSELPLLYFISILSSVFYMSSEHKLISIN